MCGIVGAIAERNVVPILIEGLRRLEYRGYDSAGVAVLGSDQAISLCKTVGKVAELEARLAENPLPSSINYYSAVTFPEEDRISWALKNSYLVLGETDIRNDTQLVIFDQFVPGSKVLAAANADHWAIAVPVARTHSIVGGTLVNRNDYPREAFMEALLRYVEEDLSGN